VGRWGFVVAQERVLLGAPSIIAGAPSTNHEKTEIPLTDQVDP